MSPLRQMAAEWPNQKLYPDSPRKTVLSAQTQLMSTRCQNSRLKSEIRNYVEKNPHATHFHPKLYFDDVEQKTGVFILF